MTGKAILTVLAAAFLLASCQASPYSRTDQFDVTIASIDASEIRKSGEQDAFGQSQILNAHSGSVDFAVAYITTNRMGVIKELLAAPRLILKSWTALKSVSFEYGEKGTHSLPGDDVDFERFSFSGKQCFHFVSAFNKSPLDEFGRYTRMVTGYYCDSSGEGLSEDRILNFLNGITVPRHSVDQAIRNLPDEGLFKPIRPIRGRMIRSQKMRWIIG